MGITADINGTDSYRVKITGDGSYQWSCPVEREYERKQYKSAIITTIIVISLVCAAALIFGASLDITFMLIYLLPVFGGMMVLIIIIMLVMGRASGNTIQRYEMNDRYIGLLNVKASVFHYYDRIQEIVVNPKYLEIHGKIRKSRVYIPQEDFPFVRDYILQHTLGRAQVRYEGTGPVS